MWLYSIMSTRKMLMVIHMYIYLCITSNTYTLIYPQSCHKGLIKLSLHIHTIFGKDGQEVCFGFDELLKDFGVIYILYQVPALLCSKMEG